MGETGVVKEDPRSLLRYITRPIISRHVSDWVGDVQLEICTM